MLLALYGIVAGAGFLSESARVTFIEGRRKPADECLYDAIHSHDTSAVNLALDEGAAIDCVNRAQCTPLMLASRAGDVSVVRALIERGANVNQQTELGTALSDAAIAGFDDIVAELLAHGADPNIGSDARLRPLWRAVASGASAQQCVTLLLEHGAQPDIRDADGITPLMMAIQNGDVEIVATLLDSGANRMLAARDGTTAITLATAQSRGQIAALLDRAARNQSSRR
jgi:ankyrin repeat protein